MTSKNNRLAGLAKEFDALLAASSSTLVVHEFTSTPGQTVFTGADNNGVVLNYLPGSVLVALNGFMLQKTSDYAATNGTSITLTSSSSGDELLQVFAFGTFTVANHYTKAEEDALRYTKTESDSNLSVVNDKIITPVYCHRTRVGASGASSKILFSEAGPTSGIVWDATNWRFVVPVDGVYEISFTGMRVSGAGSIRVLIGLMNDAPTATNCLAQAFDGSAVAQMIKINTMVSMTAGQWVCVYVEAGVGLYGGETKPYQYFSIKRVA